MVKSDSRGHLLGRLHLDSVLAGLAAVAGLAVSLWVWRLLYFSAAPSPGAGPGLYVLEMLIVSLAGAASLLGLPPGWPAIWHRMGWVAAGATAGFVFLGLWSIGPAFAPVAVLLAVAALAGDWRHKRGILAGLGLFAAGAVLQAAGMLLIIVLQ